MTRDEAPCDRWHVLGRFRDSATSKIEELAIKAEAYAIVALWDDGREIENRLRDQVGNLHKARARRRVRIRASGQHR